MNRERVPAGHLVDQDGVATPRSIDRVSLAPGDWMKLFSIIAGILGIVVAGWYGLQGDVRSLRQDEIYLKEYNVFQDKERERNRAETLQALRDINDKLDSPRFRR